MGYRIHLDVIKKSQYKKAIENEMKRNGLILFTKQENLKV